MRLPHLQQRVVGVAGLEVCEDHEGLAQLLEAGRVDLGQESARELGVCRPDGLLGGRLVHLQHVVVAELVLGDRSGEGGARRGRARKQPNAVQYHINIIIAKTTTIQKINWAQAYYLLEEIG